MILSGGQTGASSGTIDEDGFASFEWLTSFVGTITSRLSPTVGSEAIDVEVEDDASTWFSMSRFAATSPTRVEFKDYATTSGFFDDVMTNTTGAFFRKCEFNSSDGAGFLCTDPQTDVTTDDFIVALPEVAIVGTLVSLAIIAIVAGNGLVVASVFVYREMRTLTNWMIVSLATADILVAIGVLPLSAYQEVVDGRWRLGGILCDFWTTADIFCCTASILNIAAIALDRYWLITRNVTYTHGHSMPRRRACPLMAALAWTSAGVISAAPLLGWRTGEENNARAGVCRISQDYAYTIFSTFGAFWLPLLVILIVYGRIFWIAQRRLRRRMRQHYSSAVVVETGLPSVSRRRASTAIDAGPTIDASNASRGVLVRPEVTATPAEGASKNCHRLGTVPPPMGATYQQHHRQSSLPPSYRRHSELPNVAETNFLQVPFGQSVNFGPDVDLLPVPSSVFTDAVSVAPEVARAASTRRRNATADGNAILSYRKCQYRRMRNSARMLGLIIGGFVMCWMPFFLLATAVPFCGVSCNIPSPVSSLALWLGYSNSLLNPVIYAIWDRNFRNCFRRLTTCDANGTRRAANTVAFRRTHPQGPSPRTGTVAPNGGGAGVGCNSVPAYAMVPNTLPIPQIVIGHSE